jgi:subtilisin family serine protease
MIKNYLPLILLSLFLSSCGGGSGSTEPNKIPEIGNVTPQTINENTTITLTLSVTDGNSGDSHTYSATSSSSYVTPSVSGATLTLTPALNFNGNSTITIKAHDGISYSETKTFTLTVTGVNDAPSLAIISNQTTNQSVKKTASISVTDPDSLSLSYSVSSSPSGKVTGSVSGTTLTLIPLTSFDGTAAVTLTVSDGEFTDAKTFNLVVTANDPLYKYQWHLDNTGQTNFGLTAGIATQDINVNGAITDGYTGDGIIIGIIDTGLEIAHEDLSANVVLGSKDFHNDDSDPTTSATTGDHGTSVTGLIASVGWNAKGGRGVAPSASIKGYNYIAPGSNQTIARYLAAIGGATYSENVDIFNLSIGADYTSSASVNSSIEAGLASGVANLRGGKGAIYVKSSGNGFESITGFDCENVFSGNDNLIGCQNANQEPVQTNPYYISVGAISAAGVKSSYSTPGSNLWVSAPGGESGYHTGQGWSIHNDAKIFKPAMMTTDQSTCLKGKVRGTIDQKNAFDNEGNHSENTHCNYVSTFNGTSSAAPVLSGAIALILEANPALNWRDVKHILATTSDQVDASKADINITINGAPYTATEGWTTNSVGNKFHNWYGFGRVNVGAAITAAKAYTSGSLGTWINTGWGAGSGAINAVITDNNAMGVTNTIASTATGTIEYVQIFVNISHVSAGELAIELTSPAGTKSIIMNPWNAYGNSNNINSQMGSSAFYGEPMNGNWTIRVLDAKSGNTGNFTSWFVKLWGH